MHAVLVTFGTGGDVYPFVGLGAALRKRGHRVTLLTDESYGPLAARHGLGFVTLVTTAEASGMLAHPDLWHPIKSGVMAARWGARLIPQQYELLRDFARDPDVVLVSSTGILASRLVQEKHGTPTASVALQPGIIPSVDSPPRLPIGPHLRPWAPRTLRRAYFRAVDTFGGWLVGNELNRYAATLGLPPVKRLFRWWFSPELVLCLFPEWYAPRQPDWPRNSCLLGFPQGDVEGGEQMPTELEAFLAGGAAPVAFTGGTGLMYGREYFATAIAACQQAELRCVLLTKFPEQLPASLPASAITCGYAPFHKLFPRCATVVHHGGIGTVAKAMAAGVPQLVCPRAWDQRDNAVRVETLGMGTWIKPRRFTQRSVATLLGRLASAESQAECLRAAQRLVWQDGIQAACERLEEFADHRQATGRAAP